MSKRKKSSRPASAESKNASSQTVPIGRENGERVTRREVGLMLGGAAAGGLANHLFGALDKRNSSEGLIEESKRVLLASDTLSAELEVEKKLWGATGDLSHLNNYLCLLAKSGGYVIASERIDKMSPKFRGLPPEKRVIFDGNALMIHYVAAAILIAKSGGRRESQLGRVKSSYDRLGTYLAVAEAPYSLRGRAPDWIQLSKRAEDDGEGRVVPPYGAMMRGALAIGDIESYLDYYRRECRMPGAYLSAVAGHVGLVRLAQGEIVAGLDALDLMVNRGQPTSSMGHFIPIQQLFSQIADRKVSTDASFSSQATDSSANHYLACTIADLIFTSPLGVSSRPTKQVCEAFVAYGELVQQSHAAARDDIPPELSIALSRAISLLKLQAASL